MIHRSSVAMCALLSAVRMMAGDASPAPMDSPIAKVDAPSPTDSLVAGAIPPWGSLHDLVPPPGGFRACDETIATVYGGDVVPKAAILEVLNGIVDLIVPPGGFENTIVKSLIGNLVKYNIRARKICTTCEEAAAAWEERGDGRSAAEAMPYCAPGGFASGRTVSGVVVEPIDAETGEMVVGRIPGAIWTNPTDPNPFVVSSEKWSADLQDLDHDRFEIAAMASATAGAFSFLPDVLGNGGDWENKRSYVVKSLYQASTVPLVLKVQADLAAAGTCTVLDDRLSIFGYSEGGYAATATAEAMDDLGYNLTSVGVGAAPNRISGAQMEEMLSLANGTFPLPMLSARISAAYSSANPDLANTGSGQVPLSTEYMDESNELKDVREWVNHGLTYAEMVNLLPGVSPNSPEGSPADIFSSVFRDLVTKSFKAGNPNVCESEFVTNETDKICQALLDNDLTRLLESATYPVTFCHSPNDQVVYYSNLPNMTANANLMMIQERDPMLGNFLTLSGNHTKTAFECTFGFVSFFTASSDNNELRKIYDTECSVTKGGPSPPGSKTGSREGVEKVSTTVTSGLRKRNKGFNNTFFSLKPLKLEKLNLLRILSVTFSDS